MAKRKKKLSPPTTSPEPETRAAEAVTIVWMLAAFAAFCGLALHLVLLVTLAVRGGDDYLQLVLNTLSGLGLMIAVIMSPLAFGLTFAANYMRRLKPPLSIMGVAIGVSVAATLLLVLKLYEVY